MGFLKAIFVYLLPAYSASVDRVVSKAKKVYFCDTGLVNIFAKVSDGQLLENSVHNNLLSRVELRYYQKASGAEIDFIVNSQVALEVKQTGTAFDLKRIDSAARKINLKERYVISKEFVEGDGFVCASDI